MQWGGVRATVGISKGKFYFKVRIAHLSDTEATEPHIQKTLDDLKISAPQYAVYVGVSHSGSKLSNLGHAQNSWCYASSGFLEGIACLTALPRLLTLMY